MGLKGGKINCLQNYYFSLYPSTIVGKTFLPSREKTITWKICRSVMPAITCKVCTGHHGAAVVIRYRSAEADGLLTGRSGTGI